MTRNRTNDRDRIRPELLAAYVDGELDEQEAARVEEWLTAHPELAQDVADQRRLAQLWHLTPPPRAPDWDASLARLHERLSTARRPTGSRPWVLALFTVAGLAAAILLAVFWAGWPERPPLEEAGPSRVAVQPWPVVSADDVAIESLHDADRQALVVGEPPASAPLELLAVHEVVVTKLDVDDLGRMPRVSLDRGSDFPMIVMPPVDEWDDGP